MSDIEIEAGQDYNMDEVDDLPQFINKVEGVYGCALSLERDSGERNDKPYDNIRFNFVIEEVIEAKSSDPDFEVKPDDMINISFGLLLSEKDKEKGNKTSYGLRLAKPFLQQLKKELEIESSGLNDIISESQGVKVIATFATKHSTYKDAEGNEKDSWNPSIRKLIFPN